MNGTQLGEYTLREELGTGGMGTVYRAEGPDGTVAIKLLHGHLLSAPDVFKRFLREAELGRRIDHENVVRTRDMDAREIDGKTVHYLVMDYVEGQTLRHLLEELGQVPEALCRHITASIADALEAIHETGAVHRDLKPENVLITDDQVVKVMDLGVALIVDEALRLSQTGHFSGSVLYAAPEQWDLKSEVDPRTDIFSVGVMLYELATGRHPFRSGESGFTPPALTDVRPAGRVNPQLSPFFEELCACLMARDASKRLASATELGRVVREAENSTWWHKRAPALRQKTRRPLRRIRVPRPTPLFGRDEELARLRNGYDRIKAGEGNVLLIEGEAGIGKSRLVDEFVGTLESAGEDVAFLFGSYPPGSATTSAGAFSTAYREHFGAEELDGALAEHFATTPGLVPGFAALLRGTAPPEGAQPLDRESLRTAFIQATRSLARERPIIILIDDLHFAPPEGRALFTALAMAIPSDRVLLIGTARRDLPGDWVLALERSSEVERMELGRLGARDLTQLLTDAFQSESLARRLGYQIAAKSDGNPFFVFEILQDLRRRGQLKSQDGRWSTTQVLQEISVPSTVADLVSIRVGALEEEDKDLLDIAACLGYEFDPSLVADATGMELLPTLKRFARIESQQRIIRAVGREYAFDHHQFQEALYDRLFAQLREQYHQRIAEALVRRGEERPLEICEHFFAARAPERVRPYLDGAIQELEAGHLYGHAAALARKVLDTEGLVEGAERVDLLQLSSSWFERSGNKEMERAHTREAYELALALGDKKLVARTTRSKAIKRLKDGKFEECVELALRAKRMATEAGYDRVISTAATTAANAMLWLGRIEEGLALYEESFEVDSRLGKPEDILIDLGNLGRALAMLGRREEGLEKEREALEMAREHSILWAQAKLATNVGISLLEAGRIAEARAHLDESLTLCQQMGHRESEAIALVNLGWVYELMGDLEQARDWTERSIELTRETGSERIESYGWLNQAREQEWRGEPERAYESAQTALRLRREVKFLSGLPESLIQTARLSPDDAERAALLDEAAESAAETKQPGLLWLALAHRARFGLAPRPDLPTGDEDTASVFEQLEGNWALYKATGDDAHKQTTRKHLEMLRTHAPAEFADSMVERVPLYREISADA